MIAPDDYRYAAEVTHLLGHFRAHGTDAGGPIATAVNSVLHIGQLLAGPPGFQTLGDACEAVAEVLEAQLAGTDGLRMFAAARHLAGGLWLSRPSDEHPTRATLELAIHKWCTWPDDPPAPYGLPSLDDSEIELLSGLLAAAETYTLIMGTRRRVGKEQPITVTSTVPLEFDLTDNTFGLADLIEIRDQRVRDATNLLATLSGLLTEHQADGHDHRIVASEFMPLEDIAPYFLPDPPAAHIALWDGGAGMRVVEHLSRVCRAGVLAFVGERTAHLAQLDDDLVERHGFGAADIDVALECLTERVMALGYFPFEFEMHGLAVVDVPSDAEISEVVQRTADPNGRALTVTSVRAAMEFLDAGAHPVLPNQPLLQLPLRQMGHTILFDGANVQTRPRVLWEEDPSGPVKQRLEEGFEALVHTRLAALGEQPWVTGHHLKRPDGTFFTDVDASVQIGDLLVAVDTYASPWRATLDDSAISPTKSRADGLGAC